MMMMIAASDSVLVTKRRIVQELLGADEASQQARGKLIGVLFV